MTSPTPRFGPHDPVRSTPVRVPGSVRRTITFDMSRPEGPWGVIVVDLRARDLRTDESGAAHVLDRYVAEIRVDAVNGEVVAADEQEGGGDGVLVGLVGVSVRSGYSRRIGELLAAERDARTLRFSALDDLGGALLVSGYGPLREGDLPRSPDLAGRQADAQADVCAGWATGGPVLEGLRTDGLPATPLGPPAPDLDGDDPDGCHPLAPLGVGAVRRRRRLDVIPTSGGTLRLDSHFRDSYEADDGGMVMHEYLIAASVGEDRRIESVAVQPRVLPWQACPGAVPSADGIVGVGLDELPARVRAELVGVGTCTHLNSTLRSLADTHPLALTLTPHLPRIASGGDT